METARDRILEAAKLLGFDSAGIASASPSEYGSHLDTWLADGKHGDMEWMARDPERRKDVQKILPDAKSIVVVALNYFVPDQKPQDGTNKGVVARYARGRDYHKTITGMLKQLSAEIEKIGGTGTQTKLAVDTSAILEKELAQRAGIAWVGKSTIALNKNLGNWFLLGEVITNLQLEEDSPGKDHCGNCTRCLDACPTQAFTGPYKLDARKCIAYLTNESKGDIPVELRRPIGNRIFGCDDCLAVCPWNKFAKEANQFKKVYRSDLSFLDPRNLLQMTEPIFEETFIGTPLKRLGLERLQRNASVVLGNIGKEEDLKLLNQIATENPSEMVRRHAEWATQEIESRQLEIASSLRSSQ
jgi:epoxyqueuosine reductase